MSQGAIIAIALGVYVVVALGVVVGFYMYASEDEDPDSQDVALASCLWPLVLAIIVLAGPIFGAVELGKKLRKHRLHGPLPRIRNDKGKGG